MSLIPLLEQIHSCRHCEQVLPYPPKPVLQAAEQAKVLLIGQAPGRLAHDTGQPFNDRSGDRLRTWLGVSRSTFYHTDNFAIMPMGFCYPGTGKQGDHPPRPECAPLWHSVLLNTLTHVQLTLLVGRFAIQAYWPENGTSVTSAVRASWPIATTVALPHPSPRNQRWLAQNPWFEAQRLPALRAHIAQLLAS